MDIEKFVKLNEDGAIEVDRSAFQSALDSEISKAVDKYAKGKGRDEIRKQLEEEAKLSADEKLRAEKEEFEEYKKTETIKLNQEKAKAKLEGKGFSETEINYMIGNVGLDSENSMKVIDTLIEERKKFIVDTQKQTLENIQKQQQQSGTQNLASADNKDAPQVQRRSSEEILSFYTPKSQN